MKNQRSSSIRQRRSTQRKFIHASGTFLQYAGRTGKPIGEPEFHAAPLVERKTGRRKYRFYKTHFVLNGERSDSSRIKFQSHLIRGGLTLNWMIGKGFDFNVMDEDKLAKLVAVSIMTIPLSRGVIIIRGFEQLAKTDRFAFSVLFYLSKFRDEVKLARKNLKKSLRASGRKH